MNNFDDLQFESRYIVKRSLANQKVGCYIYLAFDTATEQDVVIKAVDISYKNIINSL